MSSKVDVVSIALKSLATSLETLRLDYHAFNMQIKSQFKLLKTHMKIEGE